MVERQYRISSRHGSASRKYSSLSLLPKNHPTFSQLTDQSDCVGVGTLPTAISQKELEFVSPQEDSEQRKPHARAAVTSF